MKAILLAAGEGRRLRPLTDHQPKCMVPYQGRPIIDHILEVLDGEGVGDIVVVDGYRHEVLREHLKGRPVRFVHNARYADTNMVHSLFCAERELSGDVIVSYSDIVYAPGILRALLRDDADLALTVDRRWRDLWRRRMEDPLADAESMKLDATGHITELGAVPADEHDIQGQYMGLIRFGARAAERVVRFYHGLDPDARYRGRTLDGMFMTTFLQLVIDRLMPVKAVLVDGGWVEIDTLSDLDVGACTAGSTDDLAL